MAFDFNSLSKTPISQKDVLGAQARPASTFNFDALPNSQMELAAGKAYQYGSYTPESFGMTSPTKQPVGWGISVGQDKQTNKGTSNTTPMVAEQLPEPRSYLEGVSDIINSTIETGKQNKEKYASGEINAATKYSGDVANATTIAVAPLMEVFNQIPVVGGIMKVMGEGLTFGPKGMGEALANVPGYSQILEKNPWITDYSEAVSPTVENATITALNIATLLGTVESGIKAGARGKAALEYRVTKDADGKLLTRNGDGDVVYAEDKNGRATFGEKPADYPLIRLNSALQDLKKSSTEAIENKKVTKNAETVKEIITGTKSGQNWWAQNPESEAATQRVSSKVDLSNSIDNTGTVNTRPQQEYFKQTYLDKTESAGYKLLEKEDASVNLTRVSDKLVEEFSNTNLPQSIVKKAIETILRKLSTTADELGNVKLIETAKEKSAAQRSANYERSQNNTNNEIKNKTIGRALRLVVEETSKTDIAKVNGELSKLYQELGILEKLDGMKVAGGKLGKYFSQISGNIVGGLAGGAVGGPAGAAAAAVVGGELASALRGRIMAGKFKSTTPKGEIGATLEKAIAETKKPKTVDLKTPDKKVGAPKTVKKTPEIVKLEGKIAKNVEAQRAAIKAKDFTLVAKLKQAYTLLVEELKKAIKYLNENGSVGMSIKSNVRPDLAVKKLTLKEIDTIKRYNTNPTEGSIQGDIQAIKEKIGIDKADTAVQDSFLKEVSNEYDRTFDAKDTSTSKKPTGKEGVSKQSVDTAGGFDGRGQIAKKTEDYARVEGASLDPATIKLSGDASEKTASSRASSMFDPENNSPVTLKVNKDGSLQVVDGNARVTAFKNQGKKIEKYVIDLKKSDADALKAFDTPNPLYTEARGKSLEEFVKAQGKPFEKEMYRGTGGGGGLQARGDIGNALGEGKYYAGLSQAVRYGKNIETKVVKLKNPITIKTDQDLRNITGGKNLVVSEKSGVTPQMVKKQIEEARNKIIEMGHDGVIIEMGAYQDTQNLRRLFEHDQVIVYK